MSARKHTPSYTAEFRERGVRLYREQPGEYSREFKLVRAADQTVSLRTGLV